MYKIEAEVMVRIPGSWSSFDEIEVALTLEELMLLYSTAHEVEDSNRRFTASLKGISLPSSNENSDPENEVSFDKIKQRAQARIAGVSEEQIEFAAAGVGFVEVD